MTFTNPLALLWGLLAVPIVLLYLRKVTVRREAVATDSIWQQVFAAAGSRSAWLRWRDRVSLAVQLLILGLIVVALAGPPGWLYPAGAGLLLLALEWCLYQRRWMS